MRYLLPIAAAVIVSAAPALAEESAIAEIRSAWQACTGLVAQAPDDWTGWRRSFDGGYADHFEFHDGGDGAPSVLVQTWLIDAIATQTDTACYRADGTLAFLFSRMVSPNVAAETEAPALAREGRLYFDPAGQLIRVLTRVLEGEVEVAGMDTERYSLARGCGLTAPHPTVETVRDHLAAELGDIEGGRADYTVPPLDWCAIATD
ncbi:MAG: hypothetical protein IPK28_11580 [Devosia sp.]|nr:hypothetical protein [Devosia sp.]